MIEKCSFKLHTICLISAFSVCGVCAFFRNFYKLGILGIICCSVLTVMIALVLTAVINFAFCYQEKSGFKKSAAKIIFMFIFISSLFTALASLLKHSVFVKGVMLSGVPYILILIIFLAVTLSAARAGSKALLKFVLIGALLSAVLMLVIFVSSFKNFSLQNFAFMPTYALSSFLKKAVSFSLGWTLYLVPALAFIRISLKELKATRTAFSVFISSVLISILLLQSILVLGPLCSRPDFSYITAVETVTTGSLFTRLDGFAYAAFFLNNIISIAVSVHTAVQIIKIGKNKDNKKA